MYQRGKVKKTMENKGKVAQGDLKHEKANVNYRCQKSKTWKFDTSTLLDKRANMNKLLPS